jgi:hypothetical protein
VQHHPTMHPEEDRVWLRPGQRAVVVELAAGPWRGGEIVSIEAAQGSYADCLRQIRAMPPGMLRGFARSVATAVRARVLSRSIEELSPGNDAGLMGDLLLLGALREVAGEAVLRETGVARLSVLPAGPAGDGPRPWRTRVGMAH